MNLISMCHLLNIRGNERVNKQHVKNYEELQALGDADEPRQAIQTLDAESLSQINQSRSCSAICFEKKHSL